MVTVSGVRHVDKRALARPYTVCEIALGTYVTTLQMELPAAGGTTFFKAEVDIHWTVTDPHLTATEVVTDVAQRLTAPVLERLREVSSAYRVTQAEQADRAITLECAGGRWADLGTELGMRVRLYVRLRVDDRTIERMDGIRDAHASAEVTRVHQAAFRTMLQGGELEQLSYMLAAEPEAAKDFLEKIRQEGRQDEGTGRPALRHGRQRPDPVQRHGDTGPQPPQPGPPPPPGAHRLAARPPRDPTAGVGRRRAVHPGLGGGRAALPGGPGTTRERALLGRPPGRRTRTAAPPHTLPGRRMVLGGGGPVTGDGPARTSPTRSGPCRTGVRTGPTGESASPNGC